MRHSGTIRCTVWSAPQPTKCHKTFSTTTKPILLLQQQEQQQQQQNLLKCISKSTASMDRGDFISCLGPSQVARSSESTLLVWDTSSSRYTRHYVEHYQHCWDKNDNINKIHFRNIESGSRYQGGVADVDLLLHSLIMHQTESATSRDFAEVAFCKKLVGHGMEVVIAFLQAIKVKRVQFDISNNALHQGFFLNQYCFQRNFTDLAFKEFDIKYGHDMDLASLRGLFPRSSPPCKLKKWLCKEKFWSKQLLRHKQLNELASLRLEYVHPFGRYVENGENKIHTNSAAEPDSIQSLVSALSPFRGAAKIVVNGGHVRYDKVSDEENERMCAKEGNCNQTLGNICLCHFNEWLQTINEITRDPFPSHTQFRIASIGNIYDNRGIDNTATIADALVATGKAALWSHLGSKGVFFVAAPILSLETELEQLLPTVASWQLGAFTKEQKQEWGVQTTEDSNCCDEECITLTYLYQCLHSGNNLKWMCAPYIPPKKTCENGSQCACCPHVNGGGKKRSCPNPANVVHGKRRSLQF